MAKTIDIVEDIEQSIERAKSRIIELEKALDEAKTMRFKEGDVAFHKSYGNCIITHVLISGYPRVDMAIPNVPRDNSLTGYAIVHKEGATCVKEKDLMPITDMAKTLFSKS